MKRLFAFLVIAQVLLLATCVFAQTAQIIDLKGSVSVKKDAAAAWQKAKMNMLLSKAAEIKTGKNSLCTLTFDTEMKNIMTIKENSLVKLESIIPGKVFLPEGRVFSLIDDLAKIEKFEVRTPTAIAGARGTGLSVQFLNSQTLAACYQHFVYVMGLDKQGNTGDVQELTEKFGIIINPDGTWQGPFGLSPQALKEWRDFVAYVEGLQNEPGEEGGVSGGYQEEMQDARTDTLYEHRRQEEENRGQEGGGGEGKGPR
jgi:hypothetical protein